MTELVVRLVFSLAVVLGLLMLCVRVAGRRFSTRNDALVQVVHRQSLSRSAGISVVNIGGRVLVLGTTEQQVRLLTELDPANLDDEPLELPTLAVVRNAPEAPAGADLDVDLEADLEASAALALLADEPQPGRHSAARHAAPRRGGARAAQKATPLAGSVLSPTTWKQAWGAATGRAS